MVSISYFARMLELPRHIVHTRIDTGGWGFLLVGKKIDERHPFVDYLMTLPPEDRARKFSKAQLDTWARAGTQPKPTGNAPPSAPQESTTRGDDGGTVGRVQRGQYEQRFGDIESIPLPDGRVIEIDDLLDLSFREVVERFGWSPVLKDHALALRTVEDIRDKRIRAAERAGKLVSRDLVRTHVIATLDGITRRLLTDSPARIVRAVQDAETPELAPFDVRKILEKTVKDGKADVLKTLRRVEARTVAEDEQEAETTTEEEASE